jgi:hypothetical protein
MAVVQKNEFILIFFFRACAEPAACIYNRQPYGCCAKKNWPDGFFPVRPFPLAYGVL